MNAGLPEWARKRFDPADRYGLRVTLFALATLLLMIPFLYLLLQVTSDGPLTQTDMEIADSFHDLARDSRLLVGVAKVVSFLGIPGWYYLIVGAGAMYFWRKGRSRVAAYLVVTNVVGGLINFAVKQAVGRPRPRLDEPVAEALGESFPSGHAMASTVGYGTLLLAFMPILPRRWRVPAVVGYFVWVALMALSRVVLGVHYVSDVVGGFVLGLAWLVAGTAAFSIWRTEEGDSPVEVLEGVEPEFEKTFAHGD